MLTQEEIQSLTKVLATKADIRAIRPSSNNAVPTLDDTDKRLTSILDRLKAMEESWN